MSDAATLNPYDALATFYDDAGFSNYSGAMAPRLINFLQQKGWMGSRILDLGCGTGMSTAHFAQTGLQTFAMDHSAGMMTMLERRLIGTDYHVELLHQDMREVDYPEELDLIFCVGNVLNEVRSMRDLEVVFSRAYKALSPGKIFLFDMTTIRGLAEQFGNQEHVLEVSDRILVTVQNFFNYESIAVTQRLICFVEGNGDGWQRHDSHLIMRGFPYNPIVKLLENVGFTAVSAFDSNLRPFDVARDTDGRFIIVAERN